MKKNLLKKAAALACTGAMVMGLMACGSSSTSTTESGATSDAAATESSDASASSDTADAASGNASGVTLDNIKFGFLAPTLQTEFFIGIDDGLKEVAADQGWEYSSVSFDGDSGAAVTDIENLVTSGCNVILAMVSDDSCDDALREAQEAGVIIMECGVQTEVFDICMNSSQYDIGTMISDMAADWINSEKDGKANIVVYTTLQDQDMQNRGQGIQDRITELCPDATILEVVDIGKDIVGSGTSNTETMLQKYPELDVILCYGDAAATESVEAVKAAGRADGFGIFACDGTASAISYIANDDVMHGTLQFGSVAELTLQCLTEYLNGELDDASVVPSAIYPITIDNVADFQ